MLHKPSYTSVLNFVAPFVMRCKYFWNADISCYFNL